MSALSTIILLAIVAAPTMEKTDVFAPGSDGYALFRIPGIVVTKKGTVLAYCEGRRSGAADWGAIDIVMRRSVDGGKSWSALTVLGRLDGAVAKNPVAPKAKTAKSGDVTYNNPVMIVDRDSGRVHLLYCVEYFRCFHILSDDDGVTFSKPAEITKSFDAFRPEYDWKVLATGPGHGIQLKSGRFVVPVWLSTSTGKNPHHPSVTATIFSDDRGKTWKRGAVAVPNADNAEPNESSAVELNNGSVMMIVRSHDVRSRKLVVISPNGATDWSKPAPHEDLLEPICQGSVCRWTVPGAADPSGPLLYTGPNTLEPRPGQIAKPGVGRARKNLSIKMSMDEGKSWRLGTTLEPGDSGYSDLAVLPDRTVLCLYERWNVPGYTNRGYHLTLARFNREWIEGDKNRP